MEEENLEVSRPQEPETPEVPQELPGTEPADETVPAGTETEEESQNEAVVPEPENAEPEADAENASADLNEDEIREEAPPEIDPEVYARWQELAKAHPEVVGKPLPDDIMKACIESGLPPLRVYESMMLKKQGEQIAALQQEIAALRQNAEAAERAPVTAASLGGSEGNDPVDEFLRGFNS